MKKFSRRSFLTTALCGIGLSQALTSRLIYAAETPTIRFGLSEGNPPTSYALDGLAVGIIPELLQALTMLTPTLSHTSTALPWSRAQKMVEKGQIDAFCTYPSENRKVYASFTEQPLYNLDYGYLIYAKNSPNAHVVERAESFEDMRKLKIASQKNIGWEEQNVPDYIERSYVMDIETKMHLTFLRQTADFFIMPPSQAFHYTKQYQYESLLGVRKVSFIPDSVVAFHVGIRKSFEGVEGILTLFDEVISSSEFEQRKSLILRKYEPLVSQQTYNK